MLQLELFLLLKGERESKSDGGKTCCNLFGLLSSNRTRYMERINFLFNNEICSNL